MLLGKGYLYRCCNDTSLSDFSQQSTVFSGEREHFTELEEVVTLHNGTHEIMGGPEVPSSGFRFIHV